MKMLLKRSLIYISLCIFLDTTGRLVSYLSDDEKLGIWFYDVIEIIGINVEHRKACQEIAIWHDNLFTFTSKDIYLTTGSTVEGTSVPGDNLSEFNGFT